MKNKKQKKSAEDPYNLGNISDFLYEKFSVSSTTECTGLIPSNPQSEKKKDNYRDIYDIN